MSHFIPIACLILLKKIDVDINFMLWNAYMSYLFVDIVKINKYTYMRVIYLWIAIEILNFYFQIKVWLWHIDSWKLSNII